MMRVATLVAALCAVALASRVDPIPTDKCATSLVGSWDDRIFVFSLSEDSVVWYKFAKTEGGWSLWKPVADRKKMASGPKAVRFPNGTIQVFARGTDRKYYQTTMSDGNEFSDWAPIGDETFTSPPVPIVTPQGAVAVFGVNTETHTVWYSESTPIVTEEEGPLTFGPFADIGQVASSTPSVLVDAEGLIHVYVRGINRGLHHLPEVYVHDAANPGAKKFGEWEFLGGILASSPAVPAVVDGSNLMQVFSRAADKGLWFKGQSAQQQSDAVVWDDWMQLGGVLASGPVVAVSDDGLSHVFARATDKAIYYRSQQADEGNKFTNWFSMGGMFSTTPSVYEGSDGLFHLVARGVDKAIWFARQTETNGVKEWTSWHSLGGHTRKYAC